MVRFSRVLLLLLASSVQAAESAGRYRHRGEDLPGRRGTRTGARLIGHDAGAFAPDVRPRRRREAVRAAARGDHGRRGARISHRCFRGAALSPRSRRQSGSRHRWPRRGVPGKRLGKRMVAADVAEAADLARRSIDKVMNGELAAPSTPKRDALFEKLERATRSDRIARRRSSSHGPGGRHRHRHRLRPGPESGRRAGAKSAKPAARNWRKSMRVPMRRFLAYGYRTLTIRTSSTFWRSWNLAGRQALRGPPTTHRWRPASSAMGKRTGEQLGEACANWRKPRSRLDHTFRRRRASRRRPNRRAAPPESAPAPDAPPPQPLKSEARKSRSSAQIASIRSSKR